MAAMAAEIRLLVSRLFISAAPAFNEGAMTGDEAMKIRDAATGGWAANGTAVRGRGSFTTMRGDIAVKIRRILFAPKRTWPAIAAEPMSIAGLYLRYAMPLSAIPPLCKLLGWSLLYPDIRFGTGLAAALLSYLCELIGLYVAAAIALRLVPRFEGSASFMRVLKLLAYAATASWIGGIFRLVPLLGVVSVLMSLYSAYLLYTGVTPMTGVPADRALGFTAALLGIIALVLIVTGFLVVRLIGPEMIGMV